jgi:hypothetical protein
LEGRQKLLTAEHAEKIDREFAEKIRGENLSQRTQIVNDEMLCPDCSRQFGF